MDESQNLLQQLAKIQKQQQKTSQTNINVDDVVAELCYYYGISIIKYIVNDLISYDFMLLLLKTARDIKKNDHLLNINSSFVGTNASQKQYDKIIKSIQNGN